MLVETVLGTMLVIVLMLGGMAVAGLGLMMLIAKASDGNIDVMRGGWWNLTGLRMVYTIPCDQRHPQAPPSLGTGWTDPDTGRVYRVEHTKRNYSNNTEVWARPVKHRGRDRDIRTVYFWPKEKA